MVTQLISKQRGAVVISLSIIFLLLTTFVTLYVAKGILLEQKIVNNEMRSKLAFEAAEFGLSAAIEYVSGGADRDGDDVMDPVFILVDNIGTKTVSNVGNQSVDVTVKALGTEELAFKIISQGYSDDKTATRTITQVITVQDALPNAPDNPFTSKGSISISGSGDVYNPEGNSTIWSGGDVTLDSSGTIKTRIADPSNTDPSGAKYPDCMDIPMSCALTNTVSESTVGLDVIEQDGNLANLSPPEMFENFFGMSPAVYKASKATVTITTSGEFISANKNNEIIWFDNPAGTMSIPAGTLVGCDAPKELNHAVYNSLKTCPIQDEAPSILIINGNLDIAANASIYGIVFVMGTLTAHGTPNIHGALVTAGEGANSATGSFSVWYNSRILQSVRTIAPMASLSGAWKDF